MSSSPPLRGRMLGGIILFIVLVVTIGCEEDLVSRDDFEAPFSMYGVLSPDLPVQSVRIYETESFPTLGSPEPLDVDVFSIDLRTGERLTWRDSVAIEPNGQAEHIFWSTFRAEFGHTYRIEVVRRGDGARSYAEVRVPDPVIARVADDRHASAVQVLIEGEGTRVLKPELHYSVAERPGCQIIRDRFSYQGREQRADEGWRLGINMVGDNRKILFDCGGITVFGTGPCPHFKLRALNLSMLVGNAEWYPPNGDLNPNILSDPGTMSNVQNGFGFIGAGFRMTTRLYPSKDAVEYACFEYALE